MSLKLLFLGLCEIRSPQITYLSTHIQFKTEALFLYIDGHLSVDWTLLKSSRIAVEGDNTLKGFGTSLVFSQTNKRDFKDQDH